MFVDQNQPTDAATPPTIWACGTGHWQSITGINYTGNFCAVWIITRTTLYSDTTGLDGTYDRGCDYLSIVPCFAYRSISTPWNIQSGSWFTTSGTYIIVNDSWSIVISYWLKRSHHTGHRYA